MPTRRTVLTVLGVTLFAGVLAAEIAARRLAPPAATLALMRPSGDPRTCYEPVPGARGTMDVPGLPVVPVHFDALGFRGAEVTRARPPGTVRVALVGAGRTFGLGVRDDETLAAMLERELRHRGLSAEVINAGVPSYRPVQWRAHIERDVFPLDVQAVVLDVDDGGFDPPTCLAYDPPAWLFALMPHVALVRLAAYLHGERGQWEAGSPYRRTKGLHDAVTAVDVLAREARSRGVHFALVSSSHDAVVTPRAFAAFAQAGIPLLDLVPFLPNDRRDPFYATQFGNYSARGGALLAVRIADWLVAGDMLRAAD